MEGVASKVVSGTEAEEKLNALREKIKQCQLCGLCKETNNAVPGEGSYSADVMFIGEAPGRDEDLQGKPFVGAAGKFLTEMLNEVGLSRDEVFITNIVKHRPPNNRDPFDDEIEACFPYLEQQIELIDPKIIVTLGRHAMNMFLPGLKISKDHGMPKRAQGRLSKKYIFMPLYHPASALYSPSMKATHIHDMKKIPILLKKLQSNDA